MASADIEGRSSPLLRLASIAIVIAGLSLARIVLVPLALAVLFSFLLAPLVMRLDRLGLRRGLSVGVAVLLASLVVGMIGWTVLAQLRNLNNSVPQYRGNILAKVEHIRTSVAGFGKLGELLMDIRKEAAKPASQPGASQPTTGVAKQPAASTAPVVVAPTAPVSEPAAAPMAFVYQSVESLIEPITTAGLVIVFVIFMLLGREDLRDRLIRLLSHGNLNLTIQAMDDAAGRITRYLLMQLLVNVVYGIPIAVGLYFIGVPNAFLWGLLAALLRFIPYVGIWVAASMPILLSLAIFDGYERVILTIALYIVAEVICYNAVEPWLYGGSTGMSPLAILVAAAFWTWLWGLVGLFLATPLTVCLVVIGKHVPQFRFLEILLSDEPVLSPPMRIYQRLLSLDAEEASDLVDEYLEKQSPLEVYDSILIPALGLAEQDRHRGRLNEEQATFIHETMREIIEEVGERNAAAAERAPDDRREIRPSVLCLPARDEADEIVATMLAQPLALSGCSLQVMSVTALASEMIEAAAASGAPVVCISALPPSGVAHARYLCKLLRARVPNVTVIVGLWMAKGDLKRAAERLRCDSNGKIVRTLAEAVAELSPLASARSNSAGEEASGEPATRPVSAVAAGNSAVRTPRGV